MNNCSVSLLLTALLALAAAAPLPAAAQAAQGVANGEVRAHAAFAAGATTNRAVLPLLVACAADGYAPARAAALWALGRLGAPEAEAALQKGLSDHDRAVRLAAVRGIAESAQTTLFRLLTPRLAYTLREEPSEQDPARLETRVIWTEPDPAVRLAVVQALVALGVPDAIPALTDALEREVSFNRVAVLRAIEGFGAGAAPVCLGRIVPTPYTKEAFASRMPLLVNNGALAVIAGRLGDERCVPYLLKTLSLPRKTLGEDKDLTELYIDTVTLLGVFAAEDAAEALAALLKETRVRQLSEALQVALRRIGPAAAHPLALHADDWELAPVFLPLLREPDLRSDALRGTLLVFLQNESDDVRREATETLGLYLSEGILDEYDIPLLEAMYMDPDRDVRQLCEQWKLKVAARYGEGSVQ